MKFCAYVLAPWMATLVFMATTQAQSTPDPFPEIYNSEREAGEPLTPQQALESLKLPTGFTATLFAAEPDVRNPIAATVDAAGRIWVAENYTYAERTQRFDLSLRDRVVVLEDTDANGVADKRTVFSDDIQMLTGIAVGQGGVWLMCPPQLLFVPDRDGDLVPDGKPQVKLDGFHVARENYHNFANGLSWGPDSWLYGRCGASCAGEMGLPGSSDDQRVSIRGGIWRYHPQRQVVEALTQGTTNPWGHDWNAAGELFFINTVNGHLWHGLTGAHFARPHTLDANPFAYELIDMHADHWHFDTGKGWTASRDGAANDFGGGHAHVGMMIYHEYAWPAEYRGKLFTVNMHGRRVNVEQLEPHGSGYIGRHQPDFLLSSDEWFRGMELLPLPDGNVLLLDWSDTGECHEATGVHRSSGRIFKLSYGLGNEHVHLPLPAEVRQQPQSLAAMQLTGSEWHARRARELLRSLQLDSSTPATSVDPQAESRLTALNEAAVTLTEILQNGQTTQHRLRGLFALWALDRLQPAGLVALLQDRDAAVRSWAIRLLTDHWPLDGALGGRPKRLGPTDDELTILSRLVKLAEQETAASVRLTLASLLQRLPLDARPALAQALMSHAADAQDHNLPLMVWYGLMSLPAATEQGVDRRQLQRLSELASQSHWPTTRRLIARRLTELLESAPQGIEQLMAAAKKSSDISLAEDVVLGMAQGLAGRRQLPMPSGWPALQEKLADHAAAAVVRSLGELNVLFGDGLAIDQLKQLAENSGLPVEQRRNALRALVDARAPGLRELCLKLLKQRFLNVDAARGLANETDPAVGQQLLGAFRSFAPLDRPGVISILASRSAWAALLLQAVKEGHIERHEITPYQARQIASLQVAELDQLLAENWGQVRETDAQRSQLMKTLKQQLTGLQSESANLASGRALFDKTCAACHTLFGEGGKLGPDLTGAQRSNIDYLLENIVDPSGVVTKEFRATVVRLVDGRVLTGLVTSQNQSVLTLATQEQVFHLDRSEIEEQQLTTQSTMPEGLLSQLNSQQIGDLLGYLQSSQQVELP